jgi:DNA-directed RNA polymerase subunit RPC12/RpoP
MDTAARYSLTGFANGRTTCKAGKAPFSVMLAFGLKNWKYLPPMTEKITVDVAGACPNCGNPALMVPEDYTDDSIVTCPKCDYKARRRDIFGDDDDA